MKPSPLLLYIVAFFSGATVMIVELVGSRVLAPYVGTSVYVWTSLIGVILGSLSLGYYLGGRVADKGATIRGLAKLLLVSGLSIIAISYLRHLIPFFGATTSVRIGSLLSATFLFAMPTLFLGMITPYVARLRMDSLETSGRAVGNLYAFSTLGSIVGTFLGGFFLISYFGNARIFLSLGILTLLLAFFIGVRARMIYTFGLLTLLGIIAGAGATFLPSDVPTTGKLLADKDTRYKRVWISDWKDPVTGRTARLLTDTTYGSQSGILLDAPSELLFTYQRFFDLSQHFNPRTKHTLMLGAGAFTYPTHFLATQKGAIDVVEIDDGLEPLARDFFSLKSDPRLTIIHEDGRIFLNRATTTYDAILLDAFSSFLAIPHHLATRESLNNVKRILSDDGVVIANIISGIEGIRGEFLRAEYATYVSLFPRVLLFKTNPLRNDSDMQNLIIVAFKSAREPSLTSSSAETEVLLRMIHKKAVSTDLPILTDEFAPVERYTAKLML